MTNEVNFYEVEADNEFAKSAIALVAKIFGEKNSVLLYSNNEELLKQIDSSMWSYGKNKFLPHATIFDSDFNPERQPILLSNRLENSNNAEFLIFFDLPSQDCSELDFLSQFPRSFYFFEKGKMNPEIQRKISPNNFFKKEAGKWAKIQQLPAQK